jgi:ABC-type antimicrobial peptide transport system permease subunit
MMGMSDKVYSSKSIKRWLIEVVLTKDLGKISQGLFVYNE